MPTSRWADVPATVPAEVDDLCDGLAVELGGFSGYRPADRLVGLEVVASLCERLAASARAELLAEVQPTLWGGLGELWEVG